MFIVINRKSVTTSTDIIPTSTSGTNPWCPVTYHKGRPNPSFSWEKHWYDFDTRMLLGTRIRLSWEIRWLLDLLLSARDGDRYARLFAFLIALRRVQIRLQRLGIGGARKRKGRAAAENEKVCSRMWRLRQGMMFCIDGLWSHVQVRRRFPLNHGSKIPTQPPTTHLTFENKK